ncbi:hypothetical protein JKG68_10755 [Microvirga aerilata]|uniref:Uncharacterized protein n=1 Tax=Microvirga aerilata TaxID=670292 RepID=A0A936Z6Q6_9HYPH|nr:hypothetical protein [Microvirga aerilata]MBL0404448.1 hypothetical protein [Microvirga aerilata]
MMAFGFFVQGKDGTAQSIPFAFELEDAILILKGICGKDYIPRILPEVKMVESGEFSSVSIQFDREKLLAAAISRATESINQFYITPLRKQRTRTPPAFRNSYQLNAVERAIHLARNAASVRLEVTSMTHDQP